MADQALTLTVKVNAETGQLEVVGSQLKSLGQKAETTGKSFLGLTGGAADFVKQLLPFITVVGGATFAISKLTSFISDSIKESEEFRQALTRMKSAVETTGGSWAESGRAIEDWAQNVQRSTRFSDNQAIASLDRLTRATGNLAIAQKAATLAMDISVSTGMEFSTATDLITRLVLGQQRALLEAQRAFGHVLDGVTTTTEAVKRLSAQYEGAAIAEHNLVSETEKLRNAWDDLKKNVGNALSPSLLALIDTFNDLIAPIQKVAVVSGSLMSKGVTGTLFDLKAIRATFQEIDAGAANSKKMIEDFKASAGGLGEALKGYVPPKVGLDKSGGDGNDDAEKKTEEDRKALNDRVSAHADANQRLLDAENSVDIQMAQLTDDTLAGRLEEIRAEEKAALDKINRVATTDVATEKRKQTDMEKVKGLYRKKEEIATRADAKMKAEVAINVADTAIQALQTIDGMGEISSANDARRAKMFLALRQAMAIANVWVSAMSEQTPGPIWAKVAMAAATTGLVVAQFAAQSKGIDKARAASEQEKTSTSISTDYGDGSTITDTYGGGSGVSTGGSSVSSGGVSTSSSGGGGGGGTTVINVGGVSIAFNAEHVDLSEVNAVARALYQAVVRGTTEATQMALAVHNAGVKAERLAI